MSNIKYCCFIKTAIFNFAVENDAGKAVETFRISKISIVGSNSYVQQYLISNKSQMTIMKVDESCMKNA